MAVVIDASALLAPIFEERGANIVLDRVPRSLLSAASLDEVLHKTARRGIDAASLLEELGRLQIGIQSFDTACAGAAAPLHPTLQPRGLSFADRACLATALVSGRSVLTADTLWAELDLGLDIRLIR